MTSRWTNWAGNRTADPARVVRPRSTGEVAAAVRSAAAEGLRVKAVGSGHSFTGVAVTDGVLVDLRDLAGVVAHADDGRVRVRAGTTLHRLNDELAALGLAMENLGDIDRQSLAGALATGTHGTGARLRGLAATVVGMQVVLADGRVVETSPTEHPDLFEAARVGLGAFGVVTEVELACVPAFRVEAREEPMPVARVRAELDELVDGTDHFELFWFPYTDVANTKRNRRLPAGDTTGSPLPRWRTFLEEDLLTERAFGLACEAVALAPGLARPLNRVSARALGARTFTDRSDRVFVTSRSVRFRETEWALPRAAVLDAMADLSAWFTRHDDFATPFPVEVRFTAADDVWLSTAHGRESAYVAVHQFHRMDPTPCFAAVQDIMSAYDGRPHWGKEHTLGADRLRELYPRFDDVRRVRDEVDPTRVFGNAELERVLG